MATLFALAFSPPFDYDYSNQYIVFTKTNAKEKKKVIITLYYTMKTNTNTTTHILYNIYLSALH